ncbi:MAG: carboxypeptidase regulatory-like domain-containing protein [Acidobacteria bacterium]|nr:carboxypeptidase regulatory-like domain-containing protein [Acidobacteriota bacterium]
MERFLLFVAIGFGTIAAQEAPATGTLTGKVLDATTKQGIRKASVYAVLEGPTQIRSTQFTPPATYSADTDDSGNYRLPGLPAGRYNLRAEKIGYLNAAPAKQIRAEVKPGNEIAAPELTMARHAVITGRVTDADGEPLEYVSVQAIPLRQGRGEQMRPPLQTGTDDRGEFRLARLAPGSYRIQANRVSRNATQNNAQVVGQPPLTEVPTYFPSATTEATAAVIALASGDERTGVEIRMQRAVAVRVTGTVTGGHVDAPVFVTLQSLTGPMRGVVRPYGSVLNFNAVTGPDRKFVLRNIPPGEYLLSGHSNKTGEPNAMGNMRVRVGQQDLEDVMLQVLPAVRLTGKAISEGDAKLPAQQMFVNLQSSEPMIPGGAGAAVKADGTFAIENVQRMKLMVRSNAPKGWYLKSIAIGGQRQPGLELDMAAIGDAQIELVYSNKAGTVEGNVEGAGDDSPPGIPLLMPDPGSNLPPLTNLYKTGPIDRRDNTFKIEDVPPGNYWLAAGPFWLIEALSDPASWEKLKSKAVAVKVEESGTVRGKPRLMLESDLDEK